MPKCRNISGGPLYVSFLDREVAADEVADLPDVQADGVSPVEWNTRQWEPVADKPAKSAGKAAD